MQLLTKPWPTRPDLDTYTSTELAELTGLPADAVNDASGIGFKRGGWLDPGALCRALVDASGVTTQFGQAARIARQNPDQPDHWHLGVGDAEPEAVDHVVLANGAALHDQRETAHLPITPARGQLDRFERGESGLISQVVTGLHWLVPDGDTVTAGSTYQRDDVDPQTRTTDQQLNRNGVETLLGQSVGKGVYSRAGVRATTPDRLPFVGPVCDADIAHKDWADLHRGKPADRYAPPHYIHGLSVLGGFGSRGIVTAPLSAHLLAEWLCGDGSELYSWAPEIAPHRFIVRQARKRKL